MIRRFAVGGCARWGWLAAILGLAAGGQEDAFWDGPSVDLRRGDLKVSANRRFLVHADGTPFFYLGDTAWELFHRLDREEAERYLEDRRRKGFTVIQAVALAELDGLGLPNAYGHLPLVGNDPARPAVIEGPGNDYWDHVDWIVARAAGKGIYTGLLPTWGDKWNKKWGKGPEIFTPENAETYGEWLGCRYRNQPVIWILGGDRPVENETHRAINLAMVRGLKRGDGGRHLMTFHPMGGKSSSEWFHDEDWLDFNMLQSGHRAKDLPNGDMVVADYARAPVKPCMDGEPRYDDHPVRGSKKGDWFDDYDVRQAAYWNLFAGGHGHTYGCHPVWMMRHPRLKDLRWPAPVRHFWDEVLDLPGARQMTHVRRLMEARPVLDRVPDQDLIDGDSGTGADHVRATRGKDYLFAYLPTGKPVRLRMGKISGIRVRAWWYDPRLGTSFAIGESANEGFQTFMPPSSGRGNDWVLVVDDASKRYPPPGVAGNAFPRVSLEVPSSGAEFKAPATVAVRVSASDLDGKVARVELFQGTKKLGEGSGDTYSFVWKDVPAGLYSIWARATDDRGATSDSARTAVRVGPLAFSFYRAVNLNGPPVTIDGHPWEGREAKGCSFRGNGFENQGIPLDPPTDPERARMIRSSVWDPPGSGVIMTGVPEGAYRVYLYNWEDNNSVTFDVRLGGVVVQAGVSSGGPGQWRKLGPWEVLVTDGKIELTCSSGDANLSGLEIWRAGPASK